MTIFSFNCSPACKMGESMKNKLYVALVLFGSLVFVHSELLAHHHKIYDFTIEVAESGIEVIKGNSNALNMIWRDKSYGVAQCKLWVPPKLDILNNTHGNLPVVANDLILTCRKDGRFVRLKNVLRKSYGWAHYFSTGWFIFGSSYDVPEIDFYLTYDDMVSLLKNLYSELEVMDVAFQLFAETELSLGGVDEESQTMKFFTASTHSTDEQYVRRAAYETTYRQQTLRISFKNTFLFD